MTTPDVSEQIAKLEKRLKDVEGLIEKTELEESSAISIAGRSLSRRTIAELERQKGRIVRQLKQYRNIAAGGDPLELRRTPRQFQSTGWQA